MALPDSCILTPVTFASASFVLNVTTGSNAAEDLTFGGSLNTAGRYYWTAGDGQADATTDGGLGDLAVILQTALNTHTAGGGETYSVSVSSAGVFTVTISSGDFSLNWAAGSTTLDGTIFGWESASVTSSGSALVAPNQAKGWWVPAKPTGPDSRERQPIVGGTRSTISGITKSTQLGTPKKTRTLSWQFLPKAKVLEESEAATEPFGSFEYNWVNSISAGDRFRYYVDSATRSATSFGLYRTRNMLDPMIRNEQYRVLYDVNLTVREAGA